MKQISRCDLPRSETFEGKIPRKGMTMERRSGVPRRVPRELCSITREHGSSIFGWSSKLGIATPLSYFPGLVRRPLTMIRGTRFPYGLHHTPSLIPSPIATVPRSAIFARPRR